MGRLKNGIKYVASEISENYDNSFWRKRRIDARINSPIQNRVKPVNESTYITEEDWGTIVIADAMRSDLYFDNVQNEYSSLFDEEYTVTTPGSSTTTWLKSTFGDDHGDIVYVAGNPMTSRFRRGSFHRLYEVWDEAFNQETSIIDPESVTKKALEVRNKYPNKRLIVHYMQPHYPFIGYDDLNYAEFDFDDLGINEDRRLRSRINSVWQALEDNRVNKGDVWEGYISNTRVVFEEISRILGSFDDRVVVTSDHGNMMGDRSWPIPIRSYGHPDKMRNQNLVEVPWLVREGNERRTSDDGTEQVDEPNRSDVSDRLSALGYKE